MRLSKENTILSKMFLLRYVFVEQWAFEILDGPKCDDRNFLVLPRTFATTDIQSCITWLTFLTLAVSYLSTDLGNVCVSKFIIHSFKLMMRICDLARCAEGSVT